MTSLEEYCVFKNHQFIVTDNGLETVKGAPPYWLTVDQLLDTRYEEGGEIYEHLADFGSKTWIVPEFFLEAFEAALLHHGARLVRPVDPMILERSKAAFWINVQRKRASRTAAK